MEKVLIFGRGKYYKKKSESINKKYEVIGFLDNACKGEAVDDSGIPVYNPSNIDKFCGVKIIIMSKVIVAMHGQLMGLGVDDKLIDFGQNYEPAFDKIEEYYLKNNVQHKSANNKIVISLENADYIIENENDLKSATRKLMQTLNKDVPALCGLDTTPLYDGFGSEMGTPIDRIYIEKFLEENADSITGQVMEVEDNEYTTRFGKNVKESNISHVYGWGNSVRINLETGEGVTENTLDCYILTQTLQFIYSVEKAVSNIKKMLKMGGCALITVCGIAQISRVDSENWGEYWRFTPQSCRKLFEKFFDQEKIEIKVYGNVKTATGFLYGLSAECLDEKEFDFNDDRYPVIIGIKVTK